MSLALSRSGSCWDARFAVKAASSKQNLINPE